MVEWHHNDRATLARITSEEKPMTITRFVPFRGVNDVTVLQNRLNSIFQDFARPQSDLQPTSENLTMGNFVPAVDVYEDAQKLALKLEIPGIRREDLDIRVEGRNLIVTGERKFESEEKEENFHSFVRSFTLPSSVNTDEIQATSTDGVLTISLNKRPEAKPKQIEIKVAPAQPESKQVEASTR
jgi:HSP20 family protein